MISEFISKLFPEKDASSNRWKPVKRNFLTSEEIADSIYENGYCIGGRLESSTIEKLKHLYTNLHHFQKSEGGMFYSVYSSDIKYRKEVHKGIDDILRPIYDSLFHDYKVVLNSFIVKVSGPESEFSLHQDSTGLDETKYSNLSVWIPLQDTDMTNGCMCIVPHSHKMFSPYRGISFESPFNNISDTVRKYLQPIELKAGEILLFDNRLVHNSLVNSSGNDRVVVMSGIYPSEAPIISCYKDASAESSSIELIQQEEDYLITFPNFYHDCACRPETGHSIGFVEWDTRQMTEQKFVSLCREYGVRQTNLSSLLNPSVVQTALNTPVIK